MHLTHIAGIPHRNPDLSKLVIGQELFLSPEPDNKFDPNAIKVGVVTPDGPPVHLGYIPKMETQFFCDKTSVFVHTIQPTQKWKEVLISDEKPEEKAN